MDTKGMKLEFAQEALERSKQQQSAALDAVVYWTGLVAELKETRTTAEQVGDNRSLLNG